MDAGRRQVSTPLLSIVVRVEQVISAALVLVILGLVSIQIAGRYVLTSPKTWTGELSQFGLVWLVFIGAAFVMARGNHITVTVVDQLLRPKGRMALDSLSCLVVFVTSAVLLPASLQFTARMNDIQSPAAQIPLSAFFAAGLFGFGLLALSSLLRLFVIVRQGPASYEDESEAQSR